MSHERTYAGGSFHPRPHFHVLGLGLGLGLGFKYISTILKGSEKNAESVDLPLSSYQSSFVCVPALGLGWVEA